MGSTTKILKNFYGLNNKLDPMHSDLLFLQEAVNVDIGKHGIRTRDGSTRIATGVFDASYATVDEQRMFVAMDQELCLVDINGTKTEFTPIAPLSSRDSLYWHELNEQVVYNNGTDCGIIDHASRVLPLRWSIPQSPTLRKQTGILPKGAYRVVCSYTLADGRETGAVHIAEIELLDNEALVIENIPQEVGCTTNVYICPANSGSGVFLHAFSTSNTTEVWNSSENYLGHECHTLNRYPLPEGVTYLQFWRSSLWAIQYLPTESKTVIWQSDPFNFHLFNLLESSILIKGEGCMLESVDSHLIIGTTTNIYSFNGEMFREECNFGTRHGQHACHDTIAQGKSIVIFWTKRGLCQAMPVTLLTDEFYSPEDCSYVSGAIIEKGGVKKYVASTIKLENSHNKYK